MKKIKNIIPIFLTLVLFMVSSLFFSCEENKLSSSSGDDKPTAPGGTSSLAVPPKKSLLEDKFVAAQSSVKGKLSLTVKQLDTFTGMKDKDGKAITSNDQLVYTVYGLQKDKDATPSKQEIVSSGKKVELPSPIGNKYTISDFDKLGLTTDDESQENIEEDKRYHFVVEVAIKNDPTKKTYSQVSSIIVGSKATAPSNVRNIKTTSADNGISISWTAPSLTSDHKKKDGTNLTTSDVSYKVYRVIKDESNVRTINAIIAIDENPITVPKNTYKASISDLTANTIYEIVVQAVNLTDTTRVSTGLRVEATVGSEATAPSNVSNIETTIIDNSISISWTAPSLTSDHKKKDGTNLTTSDVSYKIYRVRKDGSNVRTIDTIIAIDENPITVPKNTYKASISDLTANTTYEIVVQAVNSTDTTKVSTGLRVEATIGSEATAPSNVSNIRTSTTDNSISISWTAPSLTSDHKKRDGTNLTTSDVSYKIYRVRKDGSNVRIIDTIIAIDKNPITIQKNTLNASISDLTANTTYEIVVQAVNSTDTTKVSTGLRVEATTLQGPRLVFKKRGNSDAITSFTTQAHGEYGKTTIAPIVSEVTPDSIVSGGSFSISPDSLTRSTGLSFNTADGTIFGVAKYVVSTTTYTIKFTASDGRELENSIDITIGYKYAPADKTALINAITAELRAQAQGSDTYNHRADLNIIDTSAVRKMDGVFFNDGLGYDESKFNGNVSKWDTSNVSTMNNMFGRATAFNQDISNWNTSNVTNMGNMFKEASAFNQDISNWDVRRVTSIAMIFFEATAFDQDVSSWELCSLDTAISLSSDFRNSGIANNRNKQPTSKKGTAVCSTPNTTLIPPEVSVIRQNMMAQGLKITWQSPQITSEHVDTDGDQLTQDQIEYKIYLAKMSGFGQLPDESDIIAATTPISLVANTKRYVFANVEENAYYAVLIQTINSTDKTKVSIGERIDFKIPNIVIDNSLAYALEYAVGETVNKTITVGTNVGIIPTTTFTLSSAISQKIKKETGLTVTFDKASNTFTIKGRANKSNIWDPSIRSYQYATIEFSVPALNITKNSQLRIRTGLKKAKFVNSNGFIQTRQKSDYLRPKNTTELYHLIKDITEVEQKARRDNGYNKPDLNHIDTSAITNMDYLFNAVEGHRFEYDKKDFRPARIRRFEGDISNWNTSNVTSFDSMFQQARNFNGDISNWDVGKVKKMSYMFVEANNFNQDLSGWVLKSLSSGSSVTKSDFKGSPLENKPSNWPRLN